MWGTVRLWIVTTALFLAVVVNCSPDENLGLGGSKSRGGWGGWGRGRFPSPSSSNNNRRPLQRVKVGSDTSSSSSYQPFLSSYSHPLDPLTEEEITTTVSIIKKYRKDNLAFNYITLKEPEKSLLLPYFLKDKSPPKGSIPRKSFVILYDRWNKKTYEVTVNLDRRQVEKWEDAPDGAQPSITPDEMFDSERLAREDPEVIERSRKLGWTNMSLVNGDPWSMGYVGDRPEYEGRRLVQLYMYGKNFEEDNQYTHPFDFIVIIDLNERRVINIEDLPTHDGFDASNKRGNSVPRRESQYLPNLRDPNSFRDDLRPVNISQPEGTSYTIKGQEISWQKFKLRVGFNGREGLVIHHVNYKDGSEVRPLFYRMSLAEMFIPYGDPRPPYHRKHVYDEGQYGVGYSAFELRPQEDCLGEVDFFDSILHNDAGEVRRTPNAVCVNEEDAGILWKHTDFRTMASSVVRSQRLALTFIATVGNYDYIFAWHFYQDGSIEFNVKLSGILSSNLLAVDATPAGSGTQVFPQINAQYHQHFFTLRIDPEVDGNENSVVVSDVVPLPAATGSYRNPYGQGFTTRTTVLRTAGTSKTNTSPQTSRTWHIRNNKRINPYSKQPVAWKLMPFVSPPLMMKKDSPLREQAEWLDYNMWVTPYNEDQLFPGGFYLNNSGLSEWVGKRPNANVENTDIVLWYSMGISHVPRVEDYPVMPAETCSVMLKPTNFFNENPGLDVPPPRQRKRRDEL